MFMTIRNRIASIVIMAAVVAGGAAMAQAQNMAQVHMGHVTEGWKDTPEGRGLLPTAIAEAEIALKHAGLMMQQPDNLEWLKTHAGHVLHAIDPGAIEGGPGLGYGVLAAAAGTAKHIGLAAASEDASDNVKLHATHVAASANNTVDRVAEMKALIEKIMAATSASEAAAEAKKLQEHARQLLEGRDANGDGTVGWQKGEGGLNTAAKHMELMRKGEGL